MMRACACIVAALLAAGCGQRGPLVLPDPAAAPRRPASPPGEAQSLDPGRPAGDEPSSGTMSVPADRTKPAPRIR